MYFFRENGGTDTLKKRLNKLTRDTILSLKSIENYAKNMV